MQSTYRVIQWGVGTVGSLALRYILTNPALELIGLKCHTADKEGKTAGELCGLGPMGVKATRDVEALLAMDADCILYLGRNSFTDPTLPGSPDAMWVGEIESLLASGKNVITPISTGIHYGHLHDGIGFRNRFNAAGNAGNASVLFTGFEPGFCDVLAMTMTGAVGAIRQIKTWEIVDYGDYTGVELLRSLGFGQRPEDMPSDLSAQKMDRGGLAYLMGETLGVAVDEIQATAEFSVAPETYTAVGGLVVQKGTINAMTSVVTGLVSGKPMFVNTHINRIGQAAAPEWPTIGRDGGYRIEIDAFPPFHGEFAMGAPGGTGSTLGDAMFMTAGRLVNVIESVVKARPGYVTFLDLSSTSGRYAVAR